MRNELPPNDVINLWQGQAIENRSTSPEEVRKGMRKLERIALRRYLVGGLLCLFVMASSGRLIIILPNLIQRIGAALTVIGAAYLLYQVLLIGKRPPGAAAAATEPADCLKFYRGELERQRDYHCGLWFWSRVVILMPGPLIFTIGSANAHPARARSIYLHAAVFVSLCILGVILNLGRARKYQREIDALDAAAKQN